MRNPHGFLLLLAGCLSAQLLSSQTYLHPTQGIQNTFAGACEENTHSGTYVDDGGVGGNYSDTINNIYRTFCPDTPGKCIRLTFTQFDLEPPNVFGDCYDHLAIRNGPTQDSPLLWDSCGAHLPPVITSTDPSGCITVRFVSDAVNNAAGWRATISNVPCAGPGPSDTINTDCLNARYICQNPMAITANSQGPGLVSDACVSGCAISENYSNWFILPISAGTLGFIITPTPTTADYDFALYGPVTGGCSNLGAPIRCSYAANTGTTGMRAISTDVSEDVNGDGWVSEATVSAGSYYLMINQWAYEPNATFTIDFTGQATIGLVPLTLSYNASLCSGDTLRLAASVPGAIYVWSGPGGWTSAVQNPTRFPAVAGTYTCSYSVHGCTNSDTAVISVTLNPHAGTTSFVNVSASICQGDSLFAGGAFQRVSGVYSDTFASAGGCDSIIVTHLTVLQNSLSNWALTICQSDSVFIGGAWRNTPGVYADTLVSNNGCDSIVEINLSAVTSFTTNESAFICQGDSFFAAGAFQTVSGTYSDSLVSSAGCDSIVITQLSAGADNVWPGDANHDLIVDNSDILPIGLYYGDIGPARPSISNAWMAQCSDDWHILQSNGSDEKHADCNGDGVIDVDDTVAIALNYGLTHAKGGSPLPSTNPVITIVPHASTFYPGDTVLLDLVLGDNTNPVTELYGIAFSVLFDESNAEPGSVKLFYHDSWLGNMSSLLDINKIFELNGKADGALTRTDHQNANGYGSVATLQFIADTSIHSLQTSTVSITAYQAVNVNAGEVNFSVQDGSFTIDGTNGINAQIASLHFSIVPNPGRDAITISGKFSRNAKYEIMNALGQIVLTGELLAEKTQVDIKGLQAGFYLVRLRSQDRIGVGRLFHN